MEGGVTCGFNHANYNYYNLHAKKSKSPLLLFRSTPPFSAINKFLEVAHEKNNSPSKNNNIIDVVSSSTTTTTASTTMDDYGEFSSSSTTNNTLMHENNFVEGLFLDGSNNNNNESTTQNSELSHEVEHRNEEINSLPSNNIIKGSKEKKSKGFKDMIKGQWTEEEDRMLKTLVLKYGERKWAMIARSYLVGRAGKQCRERWHNHLRPDIKKDAWDEEEERMLVLAHQQFGNKWAEIARRIPGRSENSIKNHWNATKRRQNCRKKSSKSTKVNDNVDHLSSNPQSQSQSQPSSILQEYIKARYPSNNKTNHHHPTTTVTTTTAVEAVITSTSTSTNVSVDPPSHIEQYCFDSPTSLTTIVSNPCHEEAIFMQQLFSNENNNNNVNNNNNININTNNVNYNDPKYYYYYHNYEDEIVDSMIMDSLSFDQHNNDHNNNNIISNNINININNNIYSNKFMANQLDGRSSYDDDHQGGFGGMMVNSQPLDELDQRCDVMGDEVNNKQGYLAKKKDMDLFEMILSPNFLQSSSSNNSSYYYY